MWIDMYVPLINILFGSSAAFRARMAQYSHVLVDEVQARLAPLATCVLLLVSQATGMCHAMSKIVTDAIGCLLRE